MMKTTRRRILQLGVGGAALLGVGGALAWVTRGYAVPAGTISLALSVKERAVVRALVEALCPADAADAASGPSAPAPLPGGLALGVDQRIDEEVWSQPPEVASDLRAVLQLVEHAPPLVGAAARLTSLPPAARADALDALLRRGPAVVVQGVAALKQLCALFYWAHPATWPALGYDGPWQATPQPPPSSLRYRELVAAAAAAAATAAATTTATASSAAGAPRAAAAGATAGAAAAAGGAAGAAPAAGVATAGPRGAGATAA